jgi:dCTP deaminase
LVFHTLDDSTAAYSQRGGKYTGPVGPEFSKLALDRDWQAIRLLAPKS